MVGKKKTVVRRPKPTKKKSRRRKTFTIRVADIATGAKLLDGLVGLDNVVAFDGKAMIAELKDSIVNPLADGGLVDDALSAAEVYFVLAGVNALSKRVMGKGVGGGIGGVRISLA